MTGRFSVVDIIRPPSDGIHKGFFDAAEQHNPQHQRGGGEYQTVHDAEHRDRAGA